MVCRFLPHVDSGLTVTADLPSKFGLFIACDASQLGTEVLGHFADALLSAGAVWISAWGPDCERFHDIIDEIHVGDGELNASRPDIVTTWHSTESLDDALWFFMDTARRQNDLTTTWVTVAVTRVDWYDQIRACLDDLDFLDEDADAAR